MTSTGASTVACVGSADVDAASDKPFDAVDGADEVGTSISMAVSAAKTGVLMSALPLRSASARALPLATFEGKDGSARRIFSGDSEARGTSTYAVVESMASDLPAGERFRFLYRSELSTSGLRLMPPRRRLGPAREEAESASESISR